MDVFGGGWRDYTSKLSEYWKYRVCEGDTVVIPGDISWAMKLDEVFEDLKFIDALPGKKILMRGNHDYWWNTLSKLRKFTLENGFETISFLQNDACACGDFIICGSRGWICEDKMESEDIKILEREKERTVLSVNAALALRESLAQTEGKQREIIAFFHYPLIPYQVARRNPCFDVIKEAGIERVYYGHLHSVPDSRLVKSFEGVSMELVASDHISFTPYRIEKRL